MSEMHLGFDGLWMVLLWLSVIAVSIWLLASLFPLRYPNRVNDENDVAENALAILQQRYARGEITRQEFETTRGVLEQADGTLLDK